MLKKIFYRTLLAAVTAAALTGCDSTMQRAEHEKFLARDQTKFNRQRLDIMYQVAEQQYKVGDLDKCREQLRTALTVTTPYAPTHILAARVELEGGSLEVAEAQLKEALAIDSTKAEPFYLLGVVQQRWQKYDQACEYYQQACEINASEALYVLAVAEMQMTLGHLDGARQLLEDKMRYFEQSAAMRIALARIAVLQGDAMLAARMYRDATLLLPEDKNLRWTYASALFDANKYSDAARILEDLRRDPPTLPKVATARISHTAADAETDQAAAKSIKVTLLMTLGECYMALQRPMDARDCFTETIRLQGDNVAAYLSLGKICLLANDLNMTLDATDKVLRYEPNNMAALTLQAAALQKQEKWTEALTALNKATRLEPTNGTVLCMRGISQMQLGQKDAAADTFTKAVALTPSDSWAKELLARVRPTLSAPEPAVTTAQPTGTEGAE
jgi:tetratricopeptide (TPR) repeat protein